MGYRVIYLSFFGSVLILGGQVGHAQGLKKTEFATYEDAVTALAGRESLKILERQTPKVGSQAQACEKQAAEDQVYAYQCTFEEEKKGEATENKPRVGPTPKPNQITFYLDNDNIMMGLVNMGNDEGFTHRMGLGYLRQLKNDQSLSFDVMSEIYTKNAVRTWKSNEDPNQGYNMLMNGEINRYDREYESGKKIPVNFVDVTRFKAAYSKGKDFYFKVGLGYEIRKTSASGGKLPPAAAIQNWWHNTMGMYTYRYVSAEGQAGKVDRKDDEMIEKNGYEADQDLKSTSKGSVLVDGSVGKNIRFLSGHCTLQMEIGASVSTEGKKVVGPNSFGTAGGSLSADVFRKRDGSSRLNLSAGGAIFYFPSPNRSDVRKVGTTGSFTIASNHKVGKTDVQPFFTFWVPGGRQQFETMNDHDMVQRIGVRFLFGK